MDTIDPARLVFVDECGTHIAIVDRVRGSLVSLTEATAIRRGEALGPPPDSGVSVG